VSPITTSAPGYVPIKPLEEQTVLATIHQFPSLEPLRFETYPANHLYLPTRKDILHRAVVYEGDMTRLGTASTKNRHEVRGSRKKIRPQKGSGRARLGDKMSPMLRGGGVAFGPHPRDFSTELPKKVYDLAWRTALSYRFRKGELIIVDNAMEIEAPSTRLLADIFKHHEKLRGKGRSLLVTLDERPLLEEALIRMDRGEQTLTWEEVDVKNLLELQRVIIERDALHNILLSHEEDLTHTSLTPWHKSLIRSSPPSDLETTIGWPEFRELQVLDLELQDAARRVAAGKPDERDLELLELTQDDAERLAGPDSRHLQLLARQKADTARAPAYESVAASRYAHAQTLPPSSPQRTELEISLYDLTAESKMLQFHQTTGMRWANYAEGEAGDSAAFPAVQKLKYQIDVKELRADDVAKSSRKEYETLDLEARELELKTLEVRSQAALLAAQVHEHVAEARRLGGDEDAADQEIEMAGAERNVLAEVEYEILQQQVKLAEMRIRALVSENRFGKEMGSARGEVEMWRERLREAEERTAAEEAENALLEEGEGEGGEMVDGDVPPVKRAEVPDVKSVEGEKKM
jgi:large subunit ribosomal protein L4